MHSWKPNDVVVNVPVSHHRAMLMLNDSLKNIMKSVDKEKKTK